MNYTRTPPAQYPANSPAFPRNRAHQTRTFDRPIGCRQADPPSTTQFEGPITKNRGPVTSLFLSRRFSICTARNKGCKPCRSKRSSSRDIARPLSSVVVPVRWISNLTGGGGWIRTTEAFASDLQSDPFGHSGTPPTKYQTSSLTLALLHRGRHSRGIGMLVQCLHRHFP